MEEQPNVGDAGCLRTDCELTDVASGQLGSGSLRSACELEDVVLTGNCSGLRTDCELGDVVRGAYRGCSSADPSLPIRRSHGQAECRPTFSMPTYTYGRPGRPLPNYNVDSYLPHYGQIDSTSLKYREESETGNVVRDFDFLVGNTFELGAASFCEEAEPDAGTTVTLHVYYLNSLAKITSIPLFHTGVEVYGSEICFGRQGLHWCEPGRHACGVHSFSIPLGQTFLSEDDVFALVEAMHQEFPGNEYSLLNWNCQTFAVEFCDRLGLRDKVPSECVRFAGSRVGKSARGRFRPRVPR